MKRVFPLLLILLAGCSSGQHSALSHCIERAKAHNPRRGDDDRPEKLYLADLAGDVDICMEDAGYVFQADRPGCSGDYLNAVCYERPKLP